MTPKRYIEERKWPPLMPLNIAPYRVRRRYMIPCIIQPTVQTTKVYISTHGCARGTFAWSCFANTWFGVKALVTAVAAVRPVSQVIITMIAKHKRPTVRSMLLHRKPATMPDNDRYFQANAVLSWPNFGMIPTDD